MTEQQLVNQFKSLKPWTAQNDFSDNDWARMIAVARVVQTVDPPMVEAACDIFVQQALQETFVGYESESKLFILMRVVFDLPEHVSADERASFKGWVNWPRPDINGQVNLAWPVSWASGYPQLEDSYVGSMGPPYAAAKEYLYMRQRFPYRQLDHIQ
ncbi:MAG: hypothetical protein AAGI69_25360 [Cyanobacteria bacterium P01_H01_bin.21]